MAENIIKLRVDSKEYDQKLDRARQGLLHLEQELQKVGQNFASASKEQVQYVQSLGQMGTVSQTVRGKIGEMTKTFTELAVKYKQLSDEEKASPFGQALSASLDQLRTRIQDSRQQLDDVTRSLADTKQESGATSGIMEQLAGKFTISLDAVKLFNVGLQATQSVLSVAKDAFFNNEEQLDEWGRVVESGESVYKAFLNSINTGDISGFLSKIDSIVSAARDAYNAIDELATYNAFNQVNVERTRTGMTESIADYREGTGTKEAVRAAGDAYKKELRDRQKMEHEAYVAKIKQVAAERGVNADDLQKALSGTYGNYRELKSTPLTGTRLSVSGPFSFGAGNVTAEKYATNERERLGEALRHLNDTELQSLQALGAQAQRTGNEVAQVDKQLSRVLRGRGGGGRSGGHSTSGTDKVADPMALNSQKITDLTNEYITATETRRQAIEKEIATLQQRNAEMQKLKDMAQGKAIDGGQLPEFTVTGSKSVSNDKAFADAPLNFDSINAWTSGIKDQLKQADLGSELYNALTEKLQDASTMQDVLKQAMAGGVQGADLSEVASQMKAKLLEGDIDEDAWQEFLDKINEHIEDADLKLVFDVDDKSIETVLQKQKKNAQEMAKDWQAAGNAIQAVGNVMSQIENPAAKVMGTIAQAVASVALGASQAIEQAGNGSAGGPWGWIAFAAAATATMISTIASIHSSTGYASGGIVDGRDGGFVGGTAYSGDNVGNVRLDSGELILNRVQQDNLASQLEGGMRNIELTSVVRGEDIVLAINNRSRRMWRGEFVTSKKL